MNLGEPEGTPATLDRMRFGFGPGARNTLGTAPGSFENGRWYDVKSSVTGLRAQVFIDGKPAIDVANFCREIMLSPIEAGASLSESTGELKIKVVNFSYQARTNSIRLEVAPKIESEGTENVLTPVSIEAENSIEQPRRVTQLTRKVSGLSSDFTRTFAPPFTDHFEAEDS